MLHKKVNPRELEELKKRVELINQHTLIAQALGVQKDLYIRNILPKYGCDLNKNYTIELKSGRIKLIKPKPQK